MDRHKQVSAVQLTDVGRQLLIRGKELVKSCVGIGAPLSGYVGSEILDVGLHSRTVRSEQGQRQALDLSDQEDLAAVSAQLNLDGRLDWLTWTRIGITQCHPQSPRSLANVHPAKPQAAVVDLRTELTASAQIALNLPVPAGETPGTGQRRPQVISAGTELVFHTYDAQGAIRPQAAEDANAGGRAAGHTVLLTSEWSSGIWTAERPGIHRLCLAVHGQGNATNQMIFTARAIHMR